MAKRTALHKRSEVRKAYQNENQIEETKGQNLAARLINTTKKMCCNLLNSNSANEAGSPAYRFHDSPTHPGGPRKHRRAAANQTQQRSRTKRKKGKRKRMLPSWVRTEFIRSEKLVKEGKITKQYG